jgi:hypothetical protein
MRGDQKDLIEKMEVPPFLFSYYFPLSFFPISYLWFFLLPLPSRVARFFSVQHTKTGTNIPKNHYVNIPNGPKLPNRRM